VAINLPSDIVLEVARAADPEAARSATSRLMSLGETNGASSQDFSEIVDGMQVQSTSVGQGASQMAAPEIRDQSDPTAASSPAHAFQGFEALFLQNLIEMMLPQDSAGMFGEGTAGEMWRSMLAEQLGSQVAKSDRSGIFSRLFASAGSGPGATKDPVGHGLRSAGTSIGRTQESGGRG
jgi:hypothetical protein